MLEDVEVEYPSRSWTGLTEHKRRRDMGLGTKCAWTMHHVTNAIIEIDRDIGRGEYYVIAVHGITGADGGRHVVYAGCIYIQDVVRTPAGWRIKRHKCIVTWNDESGLMKELLGPAPPPPWGRVPSAALGLPPTRN